MKSIVIIAKGPSAIDADKFIMHGDHIAVINDAGRLIPEKKIKYMFFSHDTIFPHLDHLQNRLEFAVSRKQNNIAMDRMPSWIKEKHIAFNDWDCDGDTGSLHQRLLGGGIMSHHTTTAAIHWLAKIMKYDRIRIIGVDGGLAYAGDLERTPSLPCDLDLFMQIAKRVARICENVYGTEFEWHHK
jgi:hypothetical protein